MLSASKIARVSQLATPLVRAFSSSGKVHDIVSLPGDGIGGAVLDAGFAVLKAAGLQFRTHHADIGWEFWCKEGNPLPDRTIDLLEKYRVGFFGAITSKPKRAAAEELSPELRDKGLVYQSPIVRMRQHFNLDVCMRPCRSFEGNPLNFVKRHPSGTINEPPVDTMIFRQNTEGLYAGVEWTGAPDHVWDAFSTHPKFKVFANHPNRNDVGISTRIYTREACRRILRKAFEYAKANGKDKITIAEKPNVIRETSGMMLEEAQKMGAEEFPDIWVEDNNIDAIMMWLTKNPQDYGVVVAGNMFGDIVSDAFAGLVGGLGFACSGNCGETCAVFEPTHGSAPKYADFPVSIVNPIASVLSGAMLLDFIDEKTMAENVRSAVGSVIKKGEVRTYDMMGLRGTPDVLNQGAASTEEMAEAIIKEL